MTAAFGDFLGPAADHINAAICADDDLPDGATCGVVRELARLVATLARYAGDLAPPDEFHPAAHVLDSQRWAMREARLALRRAAQSLRQGATTVEHAGSSDVHPIVRHFAAAADHLAAGRDLLQTHFTAGPFGGRAGSSYWAPVIISAPITAALAGELAGHARRLAPWAAQVSLTGDMDSGVPASARLALHAASRWLWVAGATIEASQRDRPPDGGRALLAVIPANFAPAHRPVTDGQSVPELCEGIAISAERLRHQAIAFTRRARWSPVATSTSWRRHAMASAITTHASEHILRGLVERAAQLSISPAIRAQLQYAVDATAETWTRWRAVAGEWDITSTGTYRRAGSTPMAAEFGDLVLRAGRLAYSNPTWMPACSQASLTRDPADLAPTPAHVSTVLAAVHHAADAITQVAIEDREAVRTAAADGRLFVPTRLMPDNYDFPHPYTPAPRLRSEALIRTYDAAIQASTHSTSALDELAAALAAPSEMLALARQASPPTPDRQYAPPRQGRPARPAALSTEDTQLERTLRGLQMTELALHTRAASIDEAARGLLLEATTKARRRDTACARRSKPVR